MDIEQEAVLTHAIEQIVRRELMQSEERQRARFDAVTDDIRSELRALKRVDDAHDIRQSVMEGRVDTVQALNQAAIRDSVRAAVAEIFSPLRVLSAFGLLLGALTAVLVIFDQLRSWGMS